jgi:hypothetical protein
VWNMNAFIGRTAAPSETDLAGVLGARRLRLWQDLIVKLERERLVTSWEWYSYSPKKAGWSMRMKLDKKRTIVYVSPLEEGNFQASFALGEKAMVAARAQFSGDVAEMLREAKKYAEGSAVRRNVETAKDVAVVVELARIKVAH